MPIYGLIPRSWIICVIPFRIQRSVPINKGGQYVNFTLGHWYYPLYLVDTRFLCRLFNRSNSLDYTRRCSHPRDYLDGAAIENQVVSFNV